MFAGYGAGSAGKVRQPFALRIRTSQCDYNKLSESWSGAMAAWSFTTENSGTYPSGWIVCEGLPDGARDN